MHPQNFELFNFQTESTHEVEVCDAWCIHFCTRNSRFLSIAWQMDTFNRVIAFSEKTNRNETKINHRQSSNENLYYLRYFHFEWWSEYVVTNLIPNSLWHRYIYDNLYVRIAIAPYNRRIFFPVFILTSSGCVTLIYHYTLTKGFLSEFKLEFINLSNISSFFNCEC